MILFRTVGCQSSRAAAGGQTGIRLRRIDGRKHVPPCSESHTHVPPLGCCTCALLFLALLLSVPLPRARAHRRKRRLRERLQRSRRRSKLGRVGRPRSQRWLTAIRRSPSLLIEQPAAGGNRTDLPVAPRGEDTGHAAGSARVSRPTVSPCRRNPTTASSSCWSWKGHRESSTRPVTTSGARLTGSRSIPNGDPRRRHKATLVLGLEATTGKRLVRERHRHGQRPPFGRRASRCRRPCLHRPPGPPAPARGDGQSGRLRADLHVLGGEWHANLIRWQLSGDHARWP